MIDFLATDLVFQPFKLTRNRIQHIINAALPDTYPDRNLLKYLLTIKVPDYPGSNTYIDLVTIPNREKPPVVEGITTRYDGASFVFDSLLDGLLKRNKPTFRLATMVATAQLTTPYRLVETVQYNGSTAYVNNLVASWALKTGLTELDFDQWGTRITSTYQASKRQFLTWQPNNKRVTITQEEYLYFLLNFTPTPTTVKLRVKAIYTDASEQLLTPLQLSGVQFGQVVCVPVGSHLIGANPTKTLQSYQVWLSNQDNGRLSEVRTYHIDYRVFAQERALLFSNSFSCFDTLRLTGISTEALQVKRYSAYREKPLYQSADFTEFYVVDRAGGREITISTGFFERNVAQHLRYLDELLLTEECYLITDRNHEPLELLTNALIDHNDNPDLVARQFTFRYVREQKSYSFLPASPPFESRPTYWKPYGLVQILDSFGKRTGFVRPLKIVKTYVDDDTAVIPYTVKPNTSGDPDYISGILAPEVVVGSTPYPSELLSRAIVFVRSDCQSGYYGTAPMVTIPAGKYGGEEPGMANAMAEAEYDSLNTQDYANANGSCLLMYAENQALSIQSTFVKNNCTGTQTGTKWTITVPAGSFSAPTLSEANVLATNYANSLDTQDNANLYGSCLAGQFYQLNLPSGMANLRIRENISSEFRITGTGGTTNVANNTNVDRVISPSSTLYLEVNALGGVNVSFRITLYKNGVQVFNENNTGYASSSSGWTIITQISALTTIAEGDLLYLWIR